MIQTHPLPRSVESWVLTVGRAASKHSWRTVFPLVLRMNNVFHLVEGNRGGSSSPVGDGDDEDEGLHCGMHSREKSASELSTASSWHWRLLLSLVGDCQETMLKKQAGTLFPYCQLSHIASSPLGPRSCF